MRMIEARAYARTKVAESNLPPAAKEKLVEEFASRDRFAEADVDKRIKGERDYLARFTESGRVTMDLGEGEPLRRGPRQEDRRVQGVLHRDHRRPQGDRRLRATSTSAPGRVAGRVLRVGRQLHVRERAGQQHHAPHAGGLHGPDGPAQAWRKVATCRPVNDFRTQERFRVGGYGNLPAVAQSGAYNALARPATRRRPTR
jgi:hypothetical protein